MTSDDDHQNCLTACRHYSSHNVGVKFNLEVKGRSHYDILVWDTCGIPHYCQRLLSVNANEFVSHTCTLWVPSFIHSNRDNSRLIGEVYNVPQRTLLTSHSTVASFSQASAATATEKSLTKTEWRCASVINIAELISLAFLCNANSSNSLYFSKERGP